MSTVINITNYSLMRNALPQNPKFANLTIYRNIKIDKGYVLYVNC